jgi:hypothetical protein
VGEEGGEGIRKRKIILTFPLPFAFIPLYLTPLLVCKRLQTIMIQLTVVKWVRCRAAQQGRLTQPYMDGNEANRIFTNFYYSIF